MEAAVVEGDREDEGFGLGFEETELRLGLPVKSAGKRGFSETIDLKLKLAACPGHGAGVEGADWKSRTASGKDVLIAEVESPEKPPGNKAQVVGWPPVRSFRKNILSVQAKPVSGATLVKVSMDGAPYLRKVDLKTYRNYKELSAALETMFSSFTGGNCGSHVRDFLNEGKLMDLLNGSEYVPTYEDKDGDWMLVGDVPWEMFVVSCRRLRIIHSSEAVGLAPRAEEKRRNRN
ncbi:unnamed protein product [Spirodela intermedia]|uniref:Auxin-responsive protein n=1 Tax=Spirodela intermedia TaxID=51605 RepID=A0A7I8IM90_SPIIN|nr:unnamed protein product [Spirodela intermedia]CAA6658987.1 unnamed protein product [Spirodela intermedia]